ncbi:hypothetical protein JCM10212_003503 [Sporobolomyces blumeae]
MYDTAPPPYTATPHASASSSPSSRSPLLRLPIHLLFQVLSHAPLPTLVFSLKPTCRTLYLAACAEARGRPGSRSGWASGVQRAAKTTRLARPSSGILQTHAAPSTSRPLQEQVERGRARSEKVTLARTREEEIYDLYIACLARTEQNRFESVLLVDEATGGGVFDDDSGEGGIERDMFNLMQPRARCEDLVIETGRRQGWIERATDGRIDVKSSTGATINAQDVKVELGFRSAKLLLPMAGSSSTSRPVWKAAVEVPRSSTDTIEVLAARIAEAVRSKAIRRVGEGDRYETR